MATRSMKFALPGEIKAFLVLIGLIISFGWAYIAATTNIGVHVSCTVSPHACEQGAWLAQLVVLGPMVIGSIVTSIGIVLYEKWLIITKILVIATTSAALYFASFYAAAFMILAFNGIKG